jgi:AraC family transcriptional regulator of adaptative response / DNA-3-methyladenine glycosylase II
VHAAGERAHRAGCVASPRGAPLPSLAAAAAAGLRACPACRPDLGPGPAGLDRGGGLAGRAWRLLADGAADRLGGADGVARALGADRAAVEAALETAAGAGLEAVAATRRAQVAAVLLDGGAAPAVAARAAGYAGERELATATHALHGRTPAALRGPVPAEPGALRAELPARAPVDAAALLGFLGARAVRGVEALDGTTYRRVLALPRGGGTVALAPGAAGATAWLALDDVRDAPAALQRCRWLLDLDADPAIARAVLGADPLLGPLVRARPGLRIPGTVDGAELAVRAVLGQQVSVAGAATLAARLAAAFGAPRADDGHGLTHAFPAPAALAGLPGEGAGMPRTRAATLRRLAAALEAGGVDVGPGADPAAAGAALLALPGIGPWTASYVGLRALRDPDAFPAADLGIRRAVEALGADGRPRPLLALAERWRPHRGLAAQHLWAHHAALAARSPTVGGLSPGS